MDQNWNNGANGNSMPAPNMGMDPNAVPNNGMNQQMQQPQMVAPAPNMNMGGGVPVVNQPGVAAAQMPAAPKSGKSTLVETIILVIVCLIAAGAIIVAVIFFMRYSELNEAHEAQVAAKVAEAVAVEQEAAQKNLNEKLKEPLIEFRGPSDYGSISFRYPKTWSVYVEKDGSDSSDYIAYFQPKSVPPTSDSNSRYALRFIIRNRQFDDVAKPYIAKVKNGKMKSQAFTADSNAISGTRYEGEISSHINGIFVMFKVNDKTAILQTDSTVSAEILKDYENILTTLRRNTN